MVKIRPKGLVASPRGETHVVGKQTTKRGYRTLCGKYFRDTKNSKWEGVSTRVTCQNCLKAMRTGKGVKTTKKKTTKKVATTLRGKNSKKGSKR